MSQLGVDIIKDCTERIQTALREDRFTEPEMELLIKWFDAAAAISRKTLAKKKTASGEKSYPFTRPECPFNYCDQPPGGICEQNNKCHHIV